jgi:hypothetical protein
MLRPWGLVRPVSQHQQPVPQFLIRERGRLVGQRDHLPQDRPCRAELLDGRGELVEVGGPLPVVDQRDRPGHSTQPPGGEWSWVCLTPSIWPHPGQLVSRALAVDGPCSIIGGSSGSVQDRLPHLNSLGTGEHRRGGHCGVQRHHHPAHHVAADQVHLPPQDDGVVAAPGGLAQ